MHSTAAGWLKTKIFSTQKHTKKLKFENPIDNYNHNVCNNNKKISTKCKQIFKVIRQLYIKWIYGNYYDDEYEFTNWNINIEVRALGIESLK